LYFEISLLTVMGCTLVVWRFVIEVQKVLKNSHYERGFIMFHKVKSVKPYNDYSLCVKFENNIIKQYDVKNLFDLLPDFRKLKNEGLFGSVKVDTGGYGISWNDEIDLSCDELWENGINIGKEE
jgi:hypothetical protein